MKGTTIWKRHRVVSRTMQATRALLYLLALLVFTQPAAAQLKAQTIGKIKVPSAGTLVTAVLKVPFAGTLVTADTVHEYAKDPVLAFGTIRDASGAVIEGEMWLLVAARKGGVVYYHLHDTTANGSASYAGFSVDVKATLAVHLVSEGGGSDLPEIGDDEHAFMTETIELFANSRFTKLKPMCVDEDCQPNAILVRMGEVISMVRVPRSRSEESKIMYLTYSPSGTLVDKDGLSWVETSTGNSCTSEGEYVAGRLEKLQNDWLEKGQALNGLVVDASEEVIGQLLPDGFGHALSLGNDFGDLVMPPVTNALKNAMQHLTSPLTATVVTGACEIGALAANLDIALEDTEIEAPEDCGAHSVCVRVGAVTVTELNTSTTVNDPVAGEIEEVTVTAVVETQCIESEIVFECLRG